jgi:hypothetical protein
MAWLTCGMVLIGSSLGNQMMDTTMMPQVLPFNFMLDVHGAFN